MFWSNLGKKKKAKETLEKSTTKKTEEETSSKPSDTMAELNKVLENFKSGRAPHGYVMAREPIDLMDANDILSDVFVRTRDPRFLEGLDVSYASIPPEVADETADIPLKMLMIPFIQQMDGGECLTDDYEFMQYYHPAEGEAPRANKDKEYYVLVPIRKV